MTGARGAFGWPRLGMEVLISFVRVGGSKVVSTPPLGLLVGTEETDETGMAVLRLCVGTVDIVDIWGMAWTEDTID